MFGTAVASGGFHNPNNDILVSQCPNDGIQHISFSPSSLSPKNFLVAGSWDAEVRCWEIQASGQTAPVGMYKHDGPVLSTAWSSDGQMVFSAGADNLGKMWSPATNQATPIAKHDAPIRHIFYIPDMGNGSPAVVTGSWDKSLRYWDVRAPTGNPMGSVPLQERVYAMDVRGPLMVVGTAERKIIVYDIRNPQTPFSEKLSQLKYQTRCIATFPDQTGYAVGGVEGRVSIDHVQEADKKNDFAFKCHRDQDGSIYGVNSISFHDGFGTFATAGSDGGLNFWDKDSKNRLKNFQKINQPITSTAFNHDGTIFGYSVSYDWSKGAENHDPVNAKNYILLHAVKENEIQGRKNQNRRR